MKQSALIRALAVTFAVALTHLPATASACSACMGDVNSKIAPAMNAAIFVMLGAIGLMLSIAASFGFYLMKRANAPLPPTTEFTAPTHLPEDDHS